MMCIGWYHHLDSCAAGRLGLLMTNFDFLR
jgi:hypothetical protein